MSCFEYGGYVNTVNKIDREIDMLLTVENTAYTVSSQKIDTLESYNVMAIILHKLY